MKPTVLMLFSLLLSLALVGGAASVEGIGRLVNEGRWREARLEIDHELARPGLAFFRQQALLFERERMNRIQLDFDQTREQVWSKAHALVPEVTEEMFARWESAGAVEFLEVDGKQWFFQRAADNLFRIHPEARTLKAKAHPGASVTPAYRLRDIENILAASDRTGQRFNTPVTWRVTYSLTVKPGQVPAGETIRAWLPFPVSGGRQSDVRLVASDPPLTVPSPTNAALTSLYLEKPALDPQPTRFQVVFQYTAKGFHQPVDPAQVRPVPANDPGLAPFLVERPPHLVFSEALRKLSRQIVGTEANPYLKARRCFQWVGDHIPWASAREYSTLDCLPAYAMANGHGDCGIQTMLFMALCRLNGIPARWESGWTTGSDQDMHDWCEIYLAPYGWVPVDVTYGLVKSEEERVKWFYLGGLDCHRLVVNTDHSQVLYPAKTFFRSELVDFQRGEVEWRGGNLYFNQWDWDFRVEEISPTVAGNAKTPASSK